MSALARTTQTNQSSEHSSVVSISVNARIDYILRFSKHAICVVDQDPEVYSQAASEFLAQLPSGHNAAFVSVSAKLNDIQLRSRLIEQLFPGALYDPEQALASSVSKLAKEHGQTISAVIEHAHLLSLQLLHELCQLALVSNNSDCVINLVLFAEQQVGKVLSENKSLFNKKVSIINAASGQLIAIDSTLFKTKSGFFTLTFTKAAVIAVVLLCLLSISALTFLYQRDTLSFSDLPEQMSKAFIDQKDVFVMPAQANPALDKAQVKDAQTKTSFAPNSKRSAQTTKLVAKQQTTQAAEIAASADDVFLALTGQSKVIIAALAAQPLDVLAAMTMNADSAKVSQWQERVYTNTIVLDKQPKPVNSKRSAVGINPDYFLSAKQGFVVQIAGFSYPSVFSEFISEFSELNYAGYYRNLNGQKFLVITSTIYASKNQAASAITKLPEAIQQRGAWVKSVSAINNEIQMFQSSQ